jgi:carboxyl-terminal processing protease
MRGPRAVVALLAVTLLLGACASRRDAATTTTTTRIPVATTTTTVPTASPDPLWAAALQLRAAYVATGVLDEGIFVDAAVTTLTQLIGSGVSEAERATVGESVAAEVPAGYEVVWRVWRLAEQTAPQAASRDAIEDVLRAMVAATGDPNARVFVDVEVAEDGHIDDVYQGIGAFVSEESGFIVVTQPFPGGPAARAGIEAGDVVVAVDGESVIGLPIGDVVARVRGPAGTVVRLLLERPGVGSVEVAVTREDFQLATARFRVLADGIAYLSLSGLETRTPGEVDRELEVMAAAGIRGLVIDLRGNQGGRLASAIAVADRFLDGQVIFQEESLEDGRRVSRHATRGGGFTDLPLAILIDGGTRGSAEILAAALRDHLRGPLIGTPSAGQSVLYAGRDVGDGMAVVVPTGLWYTPGGRLVFDGGLPPDIEVELTADDIASGDDVAVNQGFAYLWSLLEEA